MFRGAKARTEPVYLGIPRKKPPKKSELSPSTSFIGGCAVLPEGLEFATPTCATCGKPLLLVAQVFAGIEEGKGRSLLMYGCSKGSCGSNPGSWIAYRVEWPLLDTDKKEETAKKEEKKKPKAKELEIGEFGAGFDAVEDDGAFGAVGGDATWGGFGAEDDDAGKAVGWGVVEEEQEKEDLQSHKIDSTDAEDEIVWADTVEGRFKCRVLDHEGEPWEALETGEDDDDESGSVTSSRSGRLGMELFADDKIREMYEKYRAEEEEEAVVASLPEELGDAPPPALKYALRFQDKISVEPRQVLRYAWGGVPLWPVPPPDRWKPPPCDHCGAPRRFELQLIPTLLSIVENHDSIFSTSIPLPPSAVLVSDSDEKPSSKVSKDTPPPAAKGGGGPAPASPSERFSDQGMDWSAVLLFSCEKSCCEPECPISIRKEHIFVTSDN